MLKRIFWITLTTVITVLLTTGLLAPVGPALVAFSPEAATQIAVKVARAEGGYDLIDTKDGLTLIVHVSADEMSWTSETKGDCKEGYVRASIKNESGSFNDLPASTNSRTISTYCYRTTNLDDRCAGVSVTVKRPGIPVYPTPDDITSTPCPDCSILPTKTMTTTLPTATTIRPTKTMTTTLPTATTIIPTKTMTTTLPTETAIPTVTTTLPTPDICAPPNFRDGISGECVPNEPMRLPEPAGTLTGICVVRAENVYAVFTATVQEGQFVKASYVKNQVVQPAFFEVEFHKETNQKLPVMEVKLEKGDNVYVTGLIAGYQARKMVEVSSNLVTDSCRPLPTIEASASPTLPAIPQVTPTYWAGESVNFRSVKDDNWGWTILVIIVLIGIAVAVLAFRKRR